jgi:hypothetical protein
MAVKALLNFAAKLNSEPTKIGKTDVDDLHTYGYGDEQILETVLMVGLAKFAMSKISNAPQTRQGAETLSRTYPALCHAPRRGFPEFRSMSGRRAGCGGSSGNSCSILRAVRCLKQTSFPLVWELRRTSTRLGLKFRRKKQTPCFSFFGESLSFAYFSTPAASVRGSDGPTVMAMDGQQCPALFEV